VFPRLPSIAGCCIRVRVKLGSRVHRFRVVILYSILSRASVRFRSPSSTSRSSAEPPPTTTALYRRSCLFVYPPRNVLLEKGGAARASTSGPPRDRPATKSTSTSSSPRTSKACGSIPSKNAASPGSKVVLRPSSVSLPFRTYSYSSPSCRCYPGSTRSIGKITLAAASPCDPAFGVRG
jgi:hypothetical protein